MRASEAKLTWRGLKVGAEGQWLGLGESMGHLEWAADCGCNYRREAAGEDEDGDWMLESPDLTNELRGRPPKDLRAAKRDESINGRAKNLLRRFRCVSQCALTNMWRGGFTLQSLGTCHLRGGFTLQEPRDMSFYGAELVPLDSGMRSRISGGFEIGGKPTSG